MATHNNICIDEPTTIDKRVATISINRGVTSEEQEILVLGDPETSNTIARVLNADPASTDWGLVVRPFGNTTVVVSTGSVRVHQSTAADLNVTVAGYSTITTVSTGSVRVHQSTAADLNVTVAGYSTITTVSTGSVRVHQSTAADLNVTVAGYSTITTVSTGSVRVHQSTAADLNVTVAGYSTIVSVSTGSVRVHQSTAADLRVFVADRSTSIPGNGSTGLHVRQVLPAISNFAASTVGQSTPTGVAASNATLQQRVFAYTITSTIASAFTIGFYSSNTLLWPIQLQGVSSGVSGANLAVTPPGYLFAASSANALRLV